MQSITLIYLKKHIYKGFRRHIHPYRPV